MSIKLGINIDNIYAHSERVRKIYILCIFLICIGVFAILIQLWVNKSDDIGIDIRGNSSEMISPQYEGQSSKGQDFIITADTAKDLKDGMVLLKSPIANLFEENTDFVLDSFSGLYNDQEKLLILNEGVNLDDNNGNVFKTSEIKVDLEKNIISSDNKIDLSGKIGKITADGLEIKDKGNIIIFKGKVKMIIKEENK